MPGILKRTHDRVDADSAESAAEEPAKKRQVLENGDLGAHVNGDAGAADAAFPGNGIVPDSKMAAAAEELAQELAQEGPPEIFHVTGAYVPLSRLISRLAQLTLNDLEQVVGEMADMESKYVNGYGASRPAHITIQKKERFFEFAQNYRNKFIKLLVISQWSRQSGAVSKLIDLNHWMMLQKELFRNAAAWIGELVRLLSPSKIPPPDLKLALETLSTGKAEHIDHLNFIPAEPFTPKQLLKALRTINTLLTIRLNLHENVPPEMMDFSIHSGRVTFRVKDEFELDLSIADEAPSSQLFFIDFRFLFSPCMSELPEGPMRDHIEGKTNDVLAKEGLMGCYTFLHGFVLTHKLTMLRQQAVSLVRGRWTESIKVEPVHRSLIVQYWINRPGPKNWIEIGIKKRRTKGSSTLKAETPYIGVRWHRHGKEVLDHGVEIDAADLSLEVVLKEIIAKHTNYIFKETKRKLKEGPVYAKRILSVKHRAHQTEPTECALKVQINHTTTITIIQEPVSGLFAVSPAAGPHFRTERELNRLKDPANEASNVLALARCNSTLEQVHARIRMRRWHVVQTMHPNQETVQRLFGSNMIRYAFYRNPTWDKAWILALTTSLAGDNWWIIELRDAPRNPSPLDFASEAYQPMRRSLKVVMKHGDALVFEPSYQALSTVERSAAALLSRFVDARALTGMKTEYKQRPPVKPLPKHEVPDLFIHLPQDQRMEGQGVYWMRDMVKSTFAGLSRSRSHTNTLVTGHLRNRIPDVRRLAKNMDSALAFNPATNEFAFRLQTPIGKPSVIEIKRRLERAACLVSFINVIAQCKIACTHISLDRLTFSYDAYPPLPPQMPPTTDLIASEPLQATVIFLPNEPMRLTFEAGNPHIRTNDFLNTALNGPGGLMHVISLLRKTLNLLRAFARMEVRPPDDVRMHILPRSATHFLVRYGRGDLAIAFQVSLRQRADDGVVWIDKIQYSTRNSTAVAVLGGAAAAAAAAGTKAPAPAAKAASSTKPLTKSTESNKSTQPTTAIATTTGSSSSQPQPQADDPRFKPLKTAWKQLCTARSQNWCGLGSGIMAQPAGVESCVSHVDEVMVRALVEASDMSPPPTPSLSGSSSNNNNNNEAPQQQQVPGTAAARAANAGAAAAGGVVNSSNPKGGNNVRAGGVGVGIGVGVGVGAVGTTNAGAAAPPQQPRNQPPTNAAAVRAQQAQVQAQAQARKNNMGQQGQGVVVLD